MTEKENLLHFLRHEPYDHFPESYVFLPLDPALGDVPPIGFNKGMKGCPLIQDLDSPALERVMSGSGYDIFGVHWTGTDSASHYTHGQSPRYDDIESWRDMLRIPNVEKLDWDTFRADVEKLDTDNKLVHVMLLCGLFERTTTLTSMENCLVDLISDPEDFADMVGAIADYKIALIDKMSEYVHIDLLTYHDDWGTAKSTFMRPDLWREVIKPHTQRVYDCMNRHGITICQHSCGAIAPLVPDMIEMGAKMWDGQWGPNDIPALAKQYRDSLFITSCYPEDPFERAKAPAVLILDRYPTYETIPEFLYD